MQNIARKKKKKKKHEKETNGINITLSSTKFGAIYHFAPDVSFFLDPNEEFIAVKADGTSMNGRVVSMSFKIFAKDFSILGTVDGNFIEGPGHLSFTGSKETSVEESLGETSLRASCPAEDELMGLYHGSFSDEKNARFTLKKVASGDTLAIVGNIAFPSLGKGPEVIIHKALYHDGYVSKTLKRVTLVSDKSYFMNGRSKKLVLLCDEDEKGFFLRGVHYSSSGHIVNNIIFRKK